MADALVGPVLADVLALAQGSSFALATAFYSAARLDAMTIKATSIQIMVRLDLTSTEDWVHRSIAPDALLRLWNRHKEADIRVYYSDRAHAKVYVGDNSFLVGSANFTVRGLSGTADEILWLEEESAARKKITTALREYRSQLAELTHEQLTAYVDANESDVRALQHGVTRSEEDTLPAKPRRPIRTGSYEDFLHWLKESNVAAAKEILDRANGKGQLSGHIRMNFYGIRQFLLAHPASGKRLQSLSPNTYSLAADGQMNRAIKDFVDNEASDEGGLRVSTWRTYLPMGAGGKPKSGGGTSGNLNRMLPLMARYLTIAMH